MDVPRIVITGIGLVSPLGNTLQEYGDNLFAGRSGIGPLSGFKLQDERFSYGGQIKDFDFAQAMPGVNGKRLLRFTQLAMTAAGRALDDSGLDFEQIERTRFGTAFSSAISGAGETFHIEGQRFLLRGDRGVTPSAWEEYPSCACTTHVAIHFGLRGPVSTHSAGCVSGVDCAYWAIQQLRDGKVDGMLIGGSDAPFFPLLWAGLVRSGALAPTPTDGKNIPRPFSFDHNGIAVAEGGSAVILETEQHARLRGAHIYAEVLGAASIEEARPLSDLDPMGRAYGETILRALHDAGLPPTAIDWVQAHGTGYPGADCAESLGTEWALGKHAYNVPVSSIRGAIGQPFAAGAGLQIAAACEAIARQQVPPTLNFTRPDTNCNLDYVPNEARTARVRTVMVNCAGIGGTHAGLLIAGYER